MPTIKDVARACGLSAATVSYVVNDSRAVRPETRERVLSAVRKLNYHPSAVARGLSRKKMDTIGIIFPRTADSPISNPFYSLVLDGVLSAATQRRQSAMLFIGSMYSDAHYSLSVVRDGRCDGFIMIAPHDDTESIKALADSGTPFIIVGFRDEPGLSRVDVDDSDGARSAVEYLLALGHRRIGFAASQRADTAPFVRERIEGWQRAILNGGITPNLKWRWVGTGDWGRDGELVASTLASLAPSQRPSAILTATDENALSLLRHFRENGLRVPEDISLIGFDDVLAASSSVPPLTTVRQPLQDIGGTAVEMLLDRIEGRAAAGDVKLLPTEVIVRQSTAAPPVN